MHNDYIAPCGKWPSVVLPLPKRLSALDQRISEAVNGDDGGTWNPAAPIILASQTSTLTVSAGKIAGGVKTQRGGRIAVSGPPAFVDASDNSTTRSRTLIVPLVPKQANWVADAVATRAVFSAKQGGTVSYVPFGTTLDFAIRGLDVHDGAFLTGVSVQWKCTKSRSVLPGTQPTAEMFRSPLAGGAKQSLFSGGPVSVGAANAAAYFNGGAVQFVPFVPDQHHQIDASSWKYFLRWTEETGVNPSQNVIMSVRLTFTGITSYGYE